MPSFDIVSSFDMQEIDNAVNMVVRDIANRYDFRGSSTNVSLDKGDKSITLLRVIATIPCKSDTGLSGIAFESSA